MDRKITEFCKGKEIAEIRQYEGYPIFWIYFSDGTSVQLSAKQKPVIPEYSMRLVRFGADGMSIRPNKTNAQISGGTPSAESNCSQGRDCPNCDNQGWYTRADSNDTISIEIPAPPEGWVYDRERNVKHGEMYYINGYWVECTSKSTCFVHPVAIKAETVEPEYATWNPGDPKPNRMPTDCEMRVGDWEPTTITVRDWVDSTYRWPIKGNEDVYDEPTPV